jgi:electron transport complex protein RnfG
VSASQDDKLRRILGSAALLGLIAMLGTALLASVHGLTRERIAEQERLMVQRQLNQVLPEGTYDNAMLEDSLLLAGMTLSGHPEPVRVYRARRQGEPVAVVMNHVAPDGYNGAIRLLTGIWADGSISGVRVVAHRETPGLGDPIEVERSDWILGFNQASLRHPDPRGWAVKRDGGEFDQFTGATITPRAVVEAVQRALEYHASHFDALYRPAQAPIADG